MIARDPHHFTHEATSSSFALSFIAFREWSKSIGGWGGGGVGRSREGVGHQFLNLW